MELREVFSTVQGSLDRGEYGTVVDACTRVLDIYPSCVTAHRMLGEAWLEQGQVDPAQEHFARTLAIDPANVVARLGLGVVAEERHDLATAYKHYLNAWEVNPVLDQLRDELVRVQGHLGGDARIHPTRSALAVIYGRGGHRERALREWQVVVGADANNVRASLAMAELLWEMGFTAAAKATCDGVLARLPEAARALLILAAIDERQRGHIARETVERYLAVDPAAELAASFVESHAGTTLGGIMGAPVTIDEGALFAPAGGDATPEARQDVVVEAPRSSPLPRRPSLVAPASSQIAAPDLWGVAETSAGSGMTTDAGRPVEPFAWDDLTSQVGGAFTDGPGIAAGSARGTTNLIGSGTGMLSGDDLDAVFGRDFPPASPAPAPRPFSADTNASMEYPFSLDDDVPASDPLAGMASATDRNGARPFPSSRTDVDDLGVTPFSFDLDPASPGTAATSFGVDLTGDVMGTSDLRSAFDFALEAEIEPFGFDLDATLPNATQNAFGSGGTTLSGAGRPAPAAGDPFGLATDPISSQVSSAFSGWDALMGSAGAGGGARAVAPFDPGAFTPFDVESFAPPEDAFASLPEPVVPRAEAFAAPADVWATVEATPTPAPPMTGEPAAPRQDMMMRSGPSPFLQDDGQIDLTVGWDDLDRALADATPPAASVEGYDDLLLDLSADGIAPLEISDLADDDSWEPLSADDWDTEEAPVATAPAPLPPIAPLAVERVAHDAWDDALAMRADLDMRIPDDATPFDFAGLDLGDGADANVSSPAAGSGDAALRIAAGWDDIDAELARAIPRGSMNGYTELLKNLDSEHPMPFPATGFGGTDADVDPLAPTDVAGAQIDFEDLLAVTSEDRTAPLSHPGPLGAAIESLADVSTDPGRPGQVETWEGDPAGPTGLEASAGGPGADRGMDPFSFTDDRSAASQTSQFDAFDFSDLDGPGSSAPAGSVAPGDDAIALSWEALLADDSDRATVPLFSGSEAATAALFSATESDVSLPERQAEIGMGRAASPDASRAPSPS
ncbi:MAG: hypothetical protein WKF80_05620, partial [Thermomicrobiales bacterium]